MGYDDVVLKIGTIIESEIHGKAAYVIADYIVESWRMRDTYIKELEAEVDLYKADAERLRKHSDYIAELEKRNRELSALGETWQARLVEMGAENERLKLLVESLNAIMSDVY